ncbi:MAG: element excision factor XisH family protein [Chloroflexota bacterium]|nr:element excision factor XisH family protein [Chloroflexota bacterium]
MPADDLYYTQFVNALTKDGWSITDDPLYLPMPTRKLYVDIGAEKLLFAERQQKKIAVEIKSFIGVSDLVALYQAVGQYTLYKLALEKLQPDRVLYLAVTDLVFTKIFQLDIGSVLIENNSLSMVTFNVDSEEIVEWLHTNQTET